MSVPPLAAKNLSVPGCWAVSTCLCIHLYSHPCFIFLCVYSQYPDMLEVGVTNTQKADCGSTGKEKCVPLSVTEARTHFGAWSIVSAPLVIGMNFSDRENLKQHWPTITNAAAIEVNQDYAGFSGSIFYQSTEKEQFKPCSWWARADCGFPVAMSWYKPLSGRDSRKSTMAVLLMNNGAEPRDLSFKLGDVPGMKAASCTAYSVWEGKSMGKVGASGQTFKAVASRDSVFLTLAGCQ
jgi:hypothetical protein